MSLTGRAVIVGTGPAGLAVAETLRTEGFRGDITMIGDEPELPYDRSTLSRQVLKGERKTEHTRLRPPVHFVDKGIDLRLGTQAVGLDVANQEVVLADDDAVPYDELVIATGSVPRHLSQGHHLRGVHVLRSLHDLVMLRESLVVAHRAVIVGAGFLGSEVASILIDRMEVTLVGSTVAPMADHVGPAVAEFIGTMHRNHGVKTVTGSEVASISGRDGRVSAVHLSDGQTLRADVVLVAIGAAPAIDWLSQSSLTLADGVVCDAYCRAAPNVYAAGDVASWPNLRYGAERMRLDHRFNATEQGVAVGRNIVDRRAAPFTPLPYFWTDQYSTRLHAFGRLPPHADVEFVDGAPGERHFVALYSVEGRLTGVLGWNYLRRASLYRQILEAEWPGIPDGTPISS